VGAIALLHLTVGVALALSGWLVSRRVAGAGFASPQAAMLDIVPFVLGTGLLLLAAGRPLFGGVIPLALGAGFALTDDTMRKTLREPVVFSESVELPQVFTHPHLYLPFAGPALVVGGAAAAALLALALLIGEPAIWPARPLTALAVTAGLLVPIWFGLRKNVIGSVAGVLRRLGPSGEPFADAAALGPFAMLIVHTIIARAERPARQRALALRRDAISARLAQGGDPRRPIIVVQCESFFDARRLSSRIPRELLAGFDLCCSRGLQFGRVEVPGWGANTMRAEFAVLTGVPETELGYDRFNPYYALARVPLESQVWRLRRAGYRTICLHPFDRRFFRRDLTMPALGFERFFGAEVLGSPNRPPYCSDPQLARQILRVLDEEGPNTFIFAITMGNHGPWLPAGSPIDPAVAALFQPDEFADTAGLLRYLDGLRQSDMMLRQLMEGLEQRRSPALLAFYGDHLPSLGSAFSHFGFAEWSSDYVIWERGGRQGQRRDLAAHDLGRMVVDTACLALQEPASSLP
jgi:Sulfatase